MKKLSLPLALAAAVLLVAGAGCLKDKEFEDEEYGVQINEVKGVAFPQNNPITLAITAQTTPLTVDGPVITLEQNDIAASDVTITVVLNDALVTDAEKTVMPVGSFTIPSLTVTIPAGQKFSDALKITITNSLVLDPNQEYGIGFTISAVDQGYTIAANQKNMLFVFTVKNKYDGNYALIIKTTGWAAFDISDNLPGVWPSTDEGFSIGMITDGANSVRMFDFWGADDFAQVAFTTDNAGATTFGATAPRFIFDPATDQLTNVVNDIPDDGRGRVFAMNPAETDSRYDPATKTIYAAYILKQNGRPDLLIYDTLTFVSPTP